MTKHHRLQNCPYHKGVKCEMLSPCRYCAQFTGIILNHTTNGELYSIIKRSRILADLISHIDNKLSTTSSDVRTIKTIDTEFDTSFKKGQITAYHDILTQITKLSC